jgi:hypothetical protein
MRDAAGELELGRTKDLKVRQEVFVELLKYPDVTVVAVYVPEAWMNVS